MIRKLDNKEELTAKNIHTVYQLSYAIEAKLLEITDFPPLKRTVTDLQKSNTLFFGFWKEESLVAVVELDKMDAALDICSLVVIPEFFRQGIANKILRFVENFDDSQEILVETGFANEPAIALYKKFGFREEKVWTTSLGIKKISLRKLK